MPVTKEDAEFGRQKAKEALERLRRESEHCPTYNLNALTEAHVANAIAEAIAQKRDESEADETESFFKPIEALSDDQRDEAFAKIYEFVQESLDTMSRGERCKDFEHYVFETALEACAEASGITNLWDYYNTISEFTE